MPVTTKSSCGKEAKAYASSLSYTRYHHNAYLGMENEEIAKGETMLDTKAIRKALELGKDYATQTLQNHDLKYNRHPATESDRNEIIEDIVVFNRALSALSQLESSESAVIDIEDIDESLC